MIIWDKENQQHIIRVGQEPYPKLRATNFQIIGTNEEIENTLKGAVDLVIASANYHIYVHIFSKDPVKYILNLCRLHITPEDNWWDLTITEPPH